MMRWFGGFAGQSPPTAWPLDAEWLTSGRTATWVVGDWPANEVRTAGRSESAAAVIGPAGVSADEVRGLLTSVPPSLATRWPGSYTVAIRTESQVQIYTDLACAWPIYVMPTPLGTYWASSCRALAGLTNAAVDQQWLAAWLADPELTGPSITLGPSPFTGIYTAPAGTRLAIAVDGTVDVEAAWIRRKLSLDDGARSLSAALSAGIELRTAGSRTPSADCSGGLDSTSVCLLAARTNPDKTVMAVTVHPAGVTTGGDMDYASVAVLSEPNIDHRLLPLDDHHLPYGRLLDLPATDEPAPSTVTHARFAAEAAMLVAEGVDCHLTGDGADSLLIDTPTILADSLRRLRIRRLIRDSIDWARILHCSPWPLVRAARRPAIDDWRNSLGRRDNLSPMSRALRNSVRSAARTARADIQLAEHYGLRLHNPFTDSQVLDAVLGVEPLDHLSPRLYKLLLTTAMDDVLPWQIAERSTKGDCEADHYRGLHANRSDLVSLTQGRLAKNSPPAHPPLQQLIHDAADGLDVPLIAVEPVIAAESWMRALDRCDPIRWTGLWPQALEVTR